MLGLNQLESVAAKFVPWLVWALLIMSAYVGAKVTWGLVDPLPTITVSQLKIANLNATQQTGSTGFSKKLPSMHLFGELTKEVAVVEAPIVESAPDTRLNLVLYSTVAANEPEGGYATIGKKGKSGEFFRVDDDVLGEATLAQVFPDKVILARNGQYETLRFDEKPSAGQTGSRVVSAQNSRSQSSGSINNAVNASVQAMVSSIRDEALTDPQALVNRMGLEATGDGYRVTRRARQLMSLGLRSGDMVVAVNDNPVGNIQQDQLLVDQIIAGGDVKIEIQRGSRRFSLYHTIPN